MSSLGSVEKAARSWVVNLWWIPSVLKYTAFILMVAAMARPQWGTEQTSVSASGVNIILAVDVSESMAALDFKRGGKMISRLAAAKGVIQEFISKRQGDRIGMVVFGSEAYTQIPLTSDYETIRYVLERLEIGSAGKRTAIGDAIGISLKRLEDVNSKSDIIILLTDGRSNSGELSPETATEIAAQKGIKIYTIAVGGKGKAPFLVNHPILGERYVYQQVDIDEKTLEAIADKTNGAFYRAENVETLKKIYETIDTLEKTDVEVKVFAEYRDFYTVLLLPAFLMLVLWAVLTNTRFLRVP
jgi:Ca-activated chloride channel family protein